MFAEIAILEDLGIIITGAAVVVFLAKFLKIPSIVADIGAVVEHHLKRIGMLEPDELSEQQQLALREKRAEIEAREQDGTEKKTVAEAESGAEASFPASATLCHKCHTKAMVILDGCQTCLACGYSKCG